MAENADNDSMSPSRVARRAPSKRRASSASAETESTLARAVQPAQPGEPLRDESTLDLFAGDPLYAPAQTAETEDGRGMPGGFEAQEQSRPAVEAVVPVPDRVQAPALAEPDGAAAAVLPDVATTPTEPMLPGQALAQLRAARAAGAPRLAKDGRAVSRAAAADFTADAALSDAPDAGPGQSPEPTNARCAETSSASDRPTPESRNAGDFAPAAAVAGAAVAEAAPHAAGRVTPAVGNAEDVASAQTIDALRGEIADQRRAVADLSRRTKWMPAAVVGALLVTVATGVAQTIVLSRLASDTSAQQQRVAQMMQDQQAAIAGALAHLASAAEAPAAQATPQSPARPAATGPARHTQHAAAHGHHTHPVGQ
jgi:hypothetical protein